MSEGFAYKLRRIFLPVAAVTVALLLFYSALNWFVLSRIDSLNENTANYWLPLTIAAILELGIILPRLRRLDVGNKRGPLLVNLMALAVIAAPVMAGQAYIGEATAAITHVTDATLIGKAVNTRYYAADSICIDPANAHAAFQIAASGSQNQNLDITIYAVVPVCKVVAYFPKSVLDTQSSLQDQPGLWIGMTFFKSLDNGLDPGTKKKLYMEFVTQSQAKLEKLDTSQYKYLERSARSTDSRYYNKALTQAGVHDLNAQTVLVPHTEPFAPNPNDWAMMTGLFLVVGLALWGTVIEVLTLRDETGAETKDITLANTVIPTRQAYGLPILVDINIAVFLAMAFAGLGFIAFDSDDLIAWGGNYAPAVMQGELYRLITSQFVHGGVMHLLNNMYGLCVAGLFLTPILLNWRMILAYLITGLGGAIAGLVLHPAIVSVGASGAILGLWGVLVALALLGDGRIGDQKKMLLVNGATFAGLTVIMGSFTPGIDNAAHIGGFLTGMAVGGAIFLLDRQRRAGAAVP